MALSRSPFEQRFRSNPNERMTRPRTGPPVQNMGGLAQNTAPISQRPVSAPGVRLGTPGPAPGQIQGGGGIAPLPSGPIVTPSAQQAQGRASARNAGARKQISKFSKQQYGPAGGISPGTGKTLEDQIRGALSGMFSGEDTKGFINRSRSALGSAIEGQREQAVRRIDDDAIRRGLFRSGIPADRAAAAGSSAQSAFSTGLADILSQAQNQDIQGRQFATGAATNLLGMNRAQDQYAQSQINSARGRMGGPGTTTIVDPDTGQSYEIDQSLLRYL